MLDKKIEPGYSKTNKNIPFVASISGTTFTLVALLVQYINKHQRDVNLEVKVNRIIDLFISQYISSGYHSYGEIVSVLNEPHIQSIFKEAKIRLNYGVIDAEQAFHQAQDYAIGLALRANLHAEIRSRPKTEAHVYPVEPLSYGIYQIYASKPGRHYFLFKNVKEMKMAVNRLNEIGIHLVESSGTNFKECSDLIYRNALQELTIEVTGNALDLIRKTIAASDKKEQKQSSAEPRDMRNKGQQDIKLPVTPPEAANSSQKSSLTVVNKASKVLTLNGLMNLSIFYPYGKEKSRTHFFEAVSSKDSTLKGDCLKRTILTQFKKSLENVTNAEDLQDKISAFRKSEEYTILATGQGIFTRFFHLKTDSIKAFGTICREAESYIEKIQYPQ